MTSIDDLFKKPNLPPTSLKRKLEVPDAQQVYKSSKLSSNGSPNGSHNATGVDGYGDDDDDDLEAGPALPPDEEEEDLGDDEEGRFFGSGITRDTASALNYIEEQEGDGAGNLNTAFEPDRIDTSWLRRLATNFSRKITKNAELRSKHESSPEKFMESEADLDSEIKSWSLLTENPELYTEFVETGAAAQLVGLLAHENTDIAIGALEILAELLDEDVAVEREHLDALVRALLDADLVDLLLSNLSRLNEGAYSGAEAQVEGEQLEHETDRSGVYHSLAILDALATQPRLAETEIANARVLRYLSDRVRQPERPCSQNKQFAAEVLQVLLQTSPVVRRRFASTVPESIDIFLQTLAPYRKRDSDPPKNTHEEEFVENIFDALTCNVDDPEGKDDFVEAEGVELALIMLREGGKNITERALRLLDHALARGATVSDAAVNAAQRVADRFINQAGLKPLFAHLMKTKLERASTIEHILGILASLLRLLPGESAARIRLLAKFAERHHAPITRLAELREHQARKVAKIEADIAAERAATDADEIAEREESWFLRRLDGGLFCLQTVDVVLAWLVAEDPDAKDKIRQVLSEGGSARPKGLVRIRASLAEMIDDLGNAPEPAPGDQEDDTKEMLQTLIGFLD